MAVFNRHFRRDQRGMTYVEVLLYIFIVAMVLVVFAFFAISVLYDRTRGTATIENQEQVRYALARIEREIKDADGINTASSAFGVNLAGAGNGGLRLSLAMASSTLDPTEFSVQDGRIHIRQGSSTGTPITPDNIRIADLTFTNHSYGKSRNIGITLTTTYVNTTASQAFSASTTVRSAVELRQP